MEKNEKGSGKDRGGKREKKILRGEGIEWEERKSRKRARKEGEEKKEKEKVLGRRKGGLRKEKRGGTERWGRRIREEVVRRKKDRERGMEEKRQL